MGIFFLFHTRRYCVCASVLKTWYEIPEKSEMAQEYEKDRRT
jgi:hypothetical protein